MINKNAPFLSRRELVDAQQLFKVLLNEFKHMASQQYGDNDLSEYLHAFQERLCDQIAVERYLLREKELPAEILSIGGWPGISALALRKCGHRTTILDHPSLMDPTIQKFYRDNGIFCIAHDLGNEWTENVLQNQQFDLIECCQCIEHWNFNPIPIIQGLLKALKPQGKLYMTVPNAISLFRRISHLFGRTPYPGMACFEAQMNPNSNADVYPHWREYTQADLKHLIQICGGRVQQCWYQFHSIPEPGHARNVYYAISSMLPDYRKESA